ncbi:hypothetical protein DBR06_SOUSAS14010100 [Sousa chinensis]|nr:hypothetical protein DBR06_SOUSAS14010100 [Sousa chinensis]
METPGVQEGVEASRELNRARSRQGIARAPKHLWRQPRHPIRIQRRFHSDPDKSVGRRERDLSPRPALEKSLRSWPSSFHRRSVSKGPPDPGVSSGVCGFVATASISGELGLGI